MKSIGNLGASQSSPAVQGLTGQTASQGNEGSIFAALLTQQVNGAAVASTPDADAMPGLGQNLLGFDLAKLLPIQLSKNKNSKSDAPANQQADKAPDVPDANSALAMWVASMAAMQVQPSAQNAVPQLNDFASQLTGSGSNQNSALHALEQQFPDLMQTMQKASIPSTNPVNTLLAADVAKKADTENDFEAALQAPEAPKAEAEQPVADVQQADAQQPVSVPAPHANADVVSAVDKSGTTAGKNKIDARSAIPTATGKSNQPEQAQAPPQAKTADAKSQNQGQPQSNDSHSNNQAKKDTVTTTTQQAPDQNSNSATPANPVANNFAAATHAAMHGSSASVANSTANQPSATTSQEISVREVSAAAGVEAAPRIVQAARLMEAAGQAEMRVSVRSDVAGSVDVRAMLEGDHITATVATQHDGTRDWMMANVHELHSSLSRDDMNLRSFEVSNSGLQFSGQNQPRQQEQQQQQSRAYTNIAEETSSVSSAMNADIDTEETASRALSLLA